MIITIVRILWLAWLAIEAYAIHRWFRWAPTWAWPIAILGSVYVCWVLFLATMNLRRALKDGTMTFWGKVFGYPVALLAAFVDICFVNWNFMPIAFLRLPTEAYFTSTCSAYSHMAGWRGDEARWFCTELLNKFDINGHHCG